LSEKNFLFVNAKAESDELADLNLRTSLGAGYGRQFIDTDISALAGQIGLSYVDEDHDVSADRAFPSLSLGLKYDRKFFDDKLVYFQNVNVDSSLQDARDVLVRNRLGFRVPISDGINLSAQLNVDYDNQPAPGTKKTDTALIFSVGYGF
jgi:putative salt-induced outer membrane protein YdiY